MQISKFFSKSILRDKATSEVTTRNCVLQVKTHKYVNPITLVVNCNNKCSYTCALQTKYYYSYFSKKSVPNKVKLYREQRPTFETLKGVASIRKIGTFFQSDK